MNILLASSEVMPFAKTGGMADVCGALPAELASLGQHVAVIMPAYREAMSCGQPIESTDIRFDVPIGGKIVSGRLLRSRLPASEAPVYLVEQKDYYDRPDLYQSKGQDFRDNCERFIFFCRATLEAVRLLDLKVDLIHCHDWQTSLIPAYLKLEYYKTPGYEHIASLLTLHNIAYQGRFWHWDMLLTGLDWKHFNWREMEFYGELNLLKTGIVFADAVNTVSPSYAQQIRTEPLGCGMANVLAHRGDSLSGILNGVDYREWDPATDPHLPANYDANTYSEGKAACKAALQQEMNMEQRADVPLVGMIGRLADQKGWDLLGEVMQRWLARERVQWVVLGAGDPRYCMLVEQMAREWPGKMGMRLEFSNSLAHRIEAGADLFVMASRYEPCGLNQLYSLRYGAVPVVHSTGGLADTITDATAETLESGAANGFSFSTYDAGALDQALGRACDAYRHHPAVWKQLIQTGMTQDWSWHHSAGQYVALYERTVASRRQGATP